MTEQEVAQVLAKVVLGDNRQADRMVLAFWVESIGDLHFGDAMEAVREHRRFSPGVWLEPGHVFAGAGRARDRREREVRRQRPAILPQRVTLDRERFEQETLAAITAARAGRAVI